MAQLAIKGHATRGKEVIEILDTMSEYELSANERFVCTLSGFLSEAIRSFEFNKD